MAQVNRSQLISQRN